MSGEQSGSWQQDPFGRHRLRWWDGAQWTPQVVDDGEPFTDPLGVQPAGPPPGDALSTSASPAPPSEPLPPPAAASGSSSRSKVPVVVGGVVVTALLAVGAVVFLGGDDAGLDDDAAEELAGDVLDGLDLPGDEVDVEDVAVELDCPLDVAELDDDAIAVDTEAVGADLDDDPVLPELVVALTVFASAADAQAVVDAFGEDGTAECFAEEVDDDDAEVDIDEVDPLEVEGLRTAGFSFFDGNQEHLVVVGRFLVDVQGTADGEDEVEDALTDVVRALREGGA